MDWSARVSSEMAYRRAGGRNRYNSLRRIEASLRRFRVLELLRERHLSLSTRGCQARLAAELNVSRATISRDLAALFTIWKPCPTCHRTANPADFGYRPILTGKRPLSKPGN